MIKSLAAPYGNISFLPTGGIGTDNVREYLSLKPVIACGGSWMAPGDLITSGDFNKIRALVRQACNLIKEIEI